MPAQSTEHALAVGANSNFGAERGHSAASSSARSSPDVAGGPSPNYAPNSTSALSNQQSRPPMHSHHSPNGSVSSSANSSPRPSQPPMHANSTSLSSGSASAVTFNGTPLSRPLTHKETEMLAHLDRLKFFLATAPSRWATADGDGINEADGSFGNGATSSGRMQQGTPLMPHPNTHPALNRFLLPSGTYSFFTGLVYFYFFFRSFFLPLSFFLLFLLALCPIFPLESGERGMDTRRRGEEKSRWQATLRPPTPGCAREIHAPTSVSTVAYYPTTSIDAAAQSSDSADGQFLFIVILIFYFISASFFGFVPCLSVP